MARARALAGGPLRRRWWMAAAAALVEGRSGAGGDGHGGEGVETAAAKKNPAALETKTKTKMNCRIQGSCAHI